MLLSKRFLIIIKLNIHALKKTWYCTVRVFTEVQQSCHIRGSMKFQMPKNIHSSATHIISSTGGSKVFREKSRRWRKKKEKQMSPFLAMAKESQQTNHD
uniref:Uncharacterized protein n=1 Tax=Wuchereria bancrofti TaxID=6293 RepID=A0A1I8EW97_WUCBA